MIMIHCFIVLYSAVVVTAEQCLWPVHHCFIVYMVCVRALRVAVSWLAVCVNLILIF